MTTTETANFLRQFNEWRRGEGEDLQMPNPREIGKAIDAAVEMIDRLEAAESDAAHQKALADSALRVAEGWEEKCNSLRAKIAEMERQEPVMWANSSDINSSRINRERGGCGDQHTCSETQTTYHDTQLYALPGAKGEEK